MVLNCGRSSRLQPVTDDKTLDTGNYETEQLKKQHLSAPSREAFLARGASAPFEYLLEILAPDRH